LRCELMKFSLVPTAANKPIAKTTHTQQIVMSRNRIEIINNNQTIICWHKECFCRTITRRTPTA